MLRRPLKIVGAGQDERRLRALAGPTVEFLGPRSDAEVADLYGRCWALLFPGVEDFGITPLEAMASGRPVIAYGRGGVLETVIPINLPSAGRLRPGPTGTGQATEAHGPTGIFFHEQSEEALIGAIQQFEANRDCFDPEALRNRALAFDRQVFKGKMAAFVAGRWAVHGKATGSAGAQEI
jgi:glycosyltransferase involved in cell wall biosynthesis